MENQNTYLEKVKLNLYFIKLYIPFTNKSKGILWSPLIKKVLILATSFDYFHQTTLFSCFIHKAVPP